MFGNGQNGFGSGLFVPLYDVNDRAPLHDQPAVLPFGTLVMASNILLNIALFTLLKAAIKSAASSKKSSLAYPSIAQSSIFDSAIDCCHGSDMLSCSEKMKVLDEYALETPRNSAGHLAAEFCEDYYDLCDMGVFIYGDASGHNSLPVKGTASFFDDFTQNLKQDLRYTKRVPKQNPRYNSIAPNSMGRASFVNKLFEGVLGVRVLIHPRCTHFIGDITNCKEDANGRMEKKKEDGVEKFGHHLDAFMYFVCHEQALAKYAKFKIN